MPVLAPVTGHIDLDDRVPEAEGADHTRLRVPLDPYEDMVPRWRTSQRKS